MSNEGISILLTKQIHARLRTAYMRAYEKLADGEKDEVLINHRVKNFEILYCAECKKELVINNQIFLINNKSRFNAYCEECGLSEYDDFFIIDDSTEKKKIGRSV